MMQTSLTRPVAALAAAALLVAACGGSATSTAPTVAPVTQAPVTQVPATPGPAETQSGGLPSFALPSFVGDQELEDMLPDTIAGQPLLAISMTGDEFLGGGLGSGTEELEVLLTQLGKTPSDLSVAFGGAGTLTIVAFRIKGVPASTIYDNLVTIAQQESGGTISDATLGGKSVKKMEPDDASGTSYIYATGDVVFVVGGPTVTDAQLNEAFQKLP